MSSNVRSVGRGLEPIRYVQMTLTVTRPITISHVPSRVTRRSRVVASQPAVAAPRSSGVIQRSSSGHRAVMPAAGERHSVSVEGDALVPVRDVGREPERAHLRLERDLRLRVAVDEEDAPRITGCARLLAVDEPPEPIEQLALVGMGREA